MDKIRAGIVGYGNIGRGVEKAIGQNPDFELVAILTRRPPGTLSSGMQASGMHDSGSQATNNSTAAILHVSDAPSLKGKVDVMILCGGSATDLPEQGPQFAASFNTVDSYDTHAKIPDYYRAMDAASRSAGLISVISAGWDPGLFSLNRALAAAVLPHGSGCTFWGKGVSQGHSDAIRRVDGVEAAIQYTIPIATAIEKARKGEGGALATRDKHLRECFVVAKEGADKAAIETSIKTMPYYFAEYDTIVHFIGKDEFNANHTGMAHGGFVVHSGKTVSGRHTIEYSLDLNNNAEFTASTLVAYARAACRYQREGRSGALTVLDIPVTYLSATPDETLRKDLL
ncbi:MAG: diaminopimelate dehydrogenase [Oscillospiraceae bacterium]|nr:diaminopimelate dehydrogenase [Oscillospiraceae bacterium]